MRNRFGLAGYTLTEILIVVGIVVLLAGVMLAYSGPAREKSRQALCAEQLRQLHQAVTLYTEAYDSVEEVPGVGPLSCAVARSGVNVIKPYVKNLEILYCPDLPPSLKPKLGTSYSWSVMPKPPQGVLPGENGAYFQQMARIEKEGRDYPMWVCEIHDEAYYQPRESHVARTLTEEYVVEISIAGNIYIGRRPYMRGSIIKAFSSQ